MARLLKSWNKDGELGHYDLGEFQRDFIINIIFRDSVFTFLKPFLKGKILRSSERGVNSILTTILRF